MLMRENSNKRDTPFINFKELPIKGALFSQIGIFTIDNMKNSCTEVNLYILATRVTHLINFHSSKHANSNQITTREMCLKSLCYIVL